MVAINAQKLPETTPTNFSRAAGNAAVPFLAIILLVIVMVGSIYYPLPSGEPMAATTFIMLWLRELIFLSFLVGIAIYFGFSRLRRVLKTRRNGEQNAP